MVGTGWPWFSDADRAGYEAAEAEFAKLAGGVDPDDPWSHPEAERLDRISVGAWMRSCRRDRRTPSAPASCAMLALSAESVERTSLLSDLRKEAAAGACGFYDTGRGSRAMVEEGSATVALRMAEELERPDPLRDPGRPRSGSRSAGCAVETATGERFECEAVVSAVPVGPLRRIAIDGVSAERLASLDRQRHALAAKACFTYPESFWEARGAERHRLHGDDDDRRHLAAAPRDHLDPDPARAPRRAADHLAAPGRGRAGRGDGRRVRRAARRTRSRSTSAAGASTHGRSATSPAGARAT